MGRLVRQRQAEIDSPNSYEIPTETSDREKSDDSET